MSSLKHVLKSTPKKKIFTIYQIKLRTIRIEDAASSLSNNDRTLKNVNQFSDKKIRFSRPFGAFINSQLPRCSTARGYSTGLVPVGPAKVEACKSILFVVFFNQLSDAAPTLKLVETLFFRRFQPFLFYVSALPGGDEKMLHSVHIVVIWRMAISDIPVSIC